MSTASNIHLKDKIESKAADFRNKSGLSGVEALNLESLLLFHNVISVFKPLSMGISGMALKTINAQETKRFILVNTQQPVGRQNFTICHELYHLFIQANFEYQICQTGRFDKKADIEEYKADLFASFFLMPKNGIISLIPEQEWDKDCISLSTILKIENYFGCSRKALLIRLKDLGFLSDTIFDNFSKNVILSATRYGYSRALYEKTNENQVIGDYGDMAKKLFDNEIISESRYAGFMNDIGINIFDIPNATVDELN